MIALGALAGGCLLSACVSLRPLDELVAGQAGRYLTVDGARIWLEESGAGPPVVLVHGFGASTFSWRHVAPGLAAEFRTVAPDLLGFGFSERPEPPRLYARARQVERLVGVADALGIEQAHWVGHSYGGGLVATLAYRYPDRVRSLTLIDSTAPDYAEERRSLWGTSVFAWPFVRGIALRPSFVRRSLERSFFDDSRIDEQLIHSYLERLRVKGVVDAYVGLTRPLPGPGDDWRVDLAEIRQPTLVIWGEEDRLIDIQVARRVVAALPDARFVPLPECGHVPMEEHPERVVEELLTFLREVESAGRALREPGRPPDSG